MNRPILLAVLCYLAIVIAGCNETFDFKNTQPVVSAIGPVGPPEDNAVRIHLWVVDYEEDPVDVDVQVSIENGPWRSLTATEVSGHGLLGLTSDTDFPGREHVLNWHLDVSATLGLSVKQQTSLRIRVVPDDRASGGGVLLTSPSFKLSDGLTIPHTQLDDQL